MKVNGRYWVDMAWQGTEWMPGEPIPMPLHHASHIELTNLSAFSSLTGQQHRRVRLTVEITAVDVRPGGGTHAEWRATYAVRVIDVCDLE